MIFCSGDPFLFLIFFLFIFLVSPAYFLIFFFSNCLLILSFHFSLNRFSISNLSTFWKSLHLPNSLSILHFQRNLESHLLLFILLLLSTSMFLPKQVFHFYFLFDDSFILDFLCLTCLLVEFPPKDFIFIPGPDLKKVNDFILIFVLTL